jgi:hypothetical protein
VLTVLRFGPGYGYGYGQGDNLPQQRLTLVYRIGIVPASPGSYTAAFKVNTGDPAKSFGPVQDTFTVTAADDGGPGPGPPDSLREPERVAILVTNFSSKVRVLVPPRVDPRDPLCLTCPLKETRIETPDRRVGLVIPTNVWPLEVIGQTVEVEVKALDQATLPAPPANTVFIRGIELNTLVSGEKVTLTFTGAVTLRVPLTAADLARAGGDPPNLSVYRYDPGTGVWSSLPTTFQATPAPGVLETELDTFSLFAVGIFQPVVVTPIPTPKVMPTPAPEVTLVLPLPKGPRGDAGAKGAAGDRGSAGPAGEGGPAGPAGVKGERGPAGAVGPAGPGAPRASAVRPGLLVPQVLGVGARSWTSSG